MYDMYPSTWTDQSTSGRQPQAPAPRRRRRAQVTQPEVPVRTEG